MPEEINRIVADHVSTLLLCPTGTAVANLEREGVEQGAVLVGDVMLDAFEQNVEVARRSCRILDELGLETSRYQLLTVHRAGNVDRHDQLAAILRGVLESDRSVVFPVHPRTKAVLAAGHVEVGEKVKLIDPVGYLEMLVLEENAEAIVTDSGGVQKEAYFAGRPCITLRDATEWTETVEVGWNILVGTEPRAIADAMRTFRPRGERPSLFGDGRASERVVEALESRGSLNP
jgi:UDP-GlcNAc3NAcA epimerase